MHMSTFSVREHQFRNNEGELVLVIIKFSLWMLTAQFNLYTFYVLLMKNIVCSIKDCQNTAHFILGVFNYHVLMVVDTLATVLMLSFKTQLHYFKVYTLNVLNNVIINTA